MNTRVSCEGLSGRRSRTIITVPEVGSVGLYCVLPNDIILRFGKFGCFEKCKCSSEVVLKSFEGETHGKSPGLCDKQQQTRIVDNSSLRS